jgi:O-antigen/teichoic acid export membrane protein
MAPLAHRAAFLTLARLANYGLMLLSPIVLARVLSVEQFGRYREFLLYASLLQSIGAFAIPDSLLYFIPAHPQSPWRIVRQTVVLTFLTTALVSLGLIVIDLVSGGAVVGPYLWPLVLYLMLSVNFDFWEFYWLANHRAGAMFAYSASRLVLRLLVVVGTASFTHDVGHIIWALVTLEATRMTCSSVVFFIRQRVSRSEPPLEEPWRAQLRFCLPSGGGSLVALLNRTLSSVVVAKSLGPAALAQFAIGRFGEPIVAIVRNSISTVVLPEMVRRSRESRESPLVLWRRATVMNAMFLLPVAILVARFAETLIGTVFGEKYLPAAAVMQIYMLVLVRECFDFAPPLRAINRASPLMFSNLAALAVGALTLFLILPGAGIEGAMAASVLSCCVDAAWLGRAVSKFHGVPLRTLVPWATLGRIALAAALAAVLIVSPIWTETLGFGGVIVGSAVYLAAFALLMKLLRVPEAEALFQSLRKSMFRWSRA